MNPAWIKGMTAAALDYLYPPIHHCPQCNGEDIPVTPETAGLCSRCFATFPWLETKDLPPGVLVPARYEGGAKSLIFRLKYREAQYLAPAMARVMADCFREQAANAGFAASSDWVVIPVPLHRRRQKERGYNQSHLLARRLASVLEFSYEPQALIRHRKTAPLYRLSRQERARNLAGSMRLNQSVKEKLCQRQILLVDDIYTTGATVNACREALEPANPAGITVMAFALADLNDHHTP